MSHLPSESVSAAFFCPQNRPPKAAYFEQVRQYLLSHPTLTPLVEAILDLPKAWTVFAENNADIAAMEQGPRYMAYFRNWITRDKDPAVAAPLLETMSGIITLPMSAILLIVQYFQYLEARNITHDQFLQETRHGGIQGFCSGLLSVMAIVPSANEHEVAVNAAICLRLALGIGAYGELGDDPNVVGPTTVACRLKHAGQADAIIAKFPGVSRPLTMTT